MDIKNSPIGFFDSGVGGLSVLKEAISIMPNENYIYFGDSKNAPYGTKELDEVKHLTFNAVDFLRKKNVKAIVVACNTATSAAIEEIRNKHNDIPIIGIEPALKPAVKLNRSGKIIIMATPMTLREKKFKQLMVKYQEDSNIVPMPCAGLVEFIENGILEGDELEKYLKNKFDIYCDDIAAIVLGCTHYPFIKETLAKVVGSEIPLIDGGAGTSHELQRKLEEKGTISDSKNIGNVEIYNSTNDMKVIDFCYNLINV
ncbi:glutamate racemase [Clostridium butyricum]|uniref:glutamate racemase n=1 Tax=Clostridium butyricum TaxID=1492 RepID=UPI0003D5C0F4|nr:glutamate racemase [Clostridium butyricum]ETI91776.1 MAG: Glutamate racemase [Clostridium butyricum DORA_1]MBZ0314092.1 glutamate racemase [Clostridium butyricum]MDK2827406.1 glutamate racemase [Clostridium butyricum]MDU1005795.1 glutamate racemase [Clostridium butyricum]MDU1507942.1 glutamate racemase [Clostridium butyricum]